jgi:hypothetical protein
MKKSRFRWLIPMVVLFASTIIYSGCQPKETLVDENSIDNSKLQRLLNLNQESATSGDVVSFNEFETIYRSLNDDELLKFHEMEIRSRANLFEGEGIVLSEAHIQEHIENWKQLIKRAHKNYGKQVNHLNPTELNRLFEDSEINSTGSSSEACSNYAFPLKGVYSSTYNSSCNNVVRASSNTAPNDCDYQLRFPIPNVCISSIPVRVLPYGTTLLSAYGGYQNLIFRQTSSYAYLLLGATTIHFLVSPFQSYNFNYLRYCFAVKV